MRSVILPVNPDRPLGRSDLFTLLDWVVSTHMEDAIPGDAGLDIGPTHASYDDRAAELEGLSRLFWGAAFAFGEDREPNAGERLLAGLANGANPKHPSFWGVVGDNDQRAVEMAPIAAAMIENPSFAARLGKDALATLCRWFAGIQTIQMHPNNWRFFRILVLRALARLGWEHNAKQLADELDFIDTQYIGGGWYGDNRNLGRDYYNGFAFHYYSLLYARWFMQEEPERCHRYVERAREFALRYRYWFDDDGAHISYGRSLIYRFATASFWPLLASFGHPEMTAGEMRGLWSRSLSWWLRRRMFDAAGRITIGFAYPNMLVSEFYNSPQSPLWAMKAFFPLALPGNHPFWQAEPEPCRYPGAVIADREGGFIVQRLKGGAYALAGAPVQHEMRNCIDKYGKFAYSSRHGFAVEGWRWLERGHIGDNVLIFSPGDGKWVGRESMLESRMEGESLITVWSPMAGCKVETTQRFTPTGERRTHVVTSDRRLSFYATGHAVDVWKRAALAFTLPPEGDEPSAVGATLFSDIADAAGKFRRGAVACAPNTNLMFPLSTAPAISGEVGEGTTVVDTVLRYGPRQG